MAGWRGTGSLTNEIFFHSPASPLGRRQERGFFFPPVGIKPEEVFTTTTTTVAAAALFKRLSLRISFGRCMGCFPLAKVGCEKRGGEGGDNVASRLNGGDARREKEKGAINFQGPRKRCEKRPLSFIACGVRFPSALIVFEFLRERAFTLELKRRKSGVKQQKGSFQT